MREFEYIEEFILDVQGEYPELQIDCDYDEIIKEYEISYSDPKVWYDLGEFESYLGSKAIEYLTNHNIFNVYFGCDYSYS